MKKLLLAVLMVFCFVPVVHAALVTDTFYLDLNNAGLTGGPWATISLSQDSAIDPKTVDFTIDPLAAAFDGVGSNFGIQVFALNEVANGTLTISGLPASWDTTYNANISAFSTFSIKNSGTGSTRQDPLTFSITSTQNISLGDFEIPNLEGYLFAGHIAGFTVDGSGITSAWFSTNGTPETPVPEPKTMMLLGSGLVGMAAWGRKRFRKELLVP